MSRQYTAAEKIAYYKKLAKKKSASSYVRKVSGSGAYKVSNPNYRRKKYVRRKPYSGLSRNVGSALGGLAGSYFGPAGTAIGSAVGAAAGSLVSKVAGWGSYNVKVNSLLHSDLVPEFKNVGDRATVVRHREFIADISQAVANVFENRTYRIQPGSSETFPWLSQIAQNYEQYRFHGLIFEYKTTSGAVTTSAPLGTVVMATQYNCLSPAFSNKQQMENYEFASSTVPSDSVIHPVECDPAQTQCNGIFNIQTTEINNFNSDQRLYDLGRFNIASILPNLGNVGELWVTYEVCLYKPRLLPDSGSNCDHYQFTTGISGGTAGSTDIFYFGTDAALTDGSDGFTSLGSSSSFVPNNTNVIYFDRSFQGNVVIIYHVEGPTGTTGMSDPLFTGSAEAVPLQIINIDTANQNSLTYANTEKAIHAVAYFQINLPQNANSPVHVTLSGGLLPVTPEDGDLMVFQISSDITS